MLKNILLLTAFSTFAVIVIVAFDVYHKIQISSLPENTKKRVIPIAPNFDTKTLDSLKSRVPIVVSIEGKSQVVSEDTKTATLTPSPTITPTLSLTQQSVATTSVIPR